MNLGSALEQALSKVGGFFQNLMGDRFSDSTPTPTPTPTPKPGYQYIEGTNIQAPIGSDLHPPQEGRIRLKNKPKTGARVKQPTPTPTIAQMKATEEAMRGRIPVNMAALPSTTQKNLSLLDEAINRAATQFPVNKNLLYDIAFTESSWNPRSVNEIGASGLYQFTPGTWQQVLRYSRDPKSSLHGRLPSEDVLDPYANAMAAAYLISKGQLGKWDASEWNWGSKYDLSKELEEPGYYTQSVYHIPGTRASIRLGTAP